MAKYTGSGNAGAATATVAAAGIIQVAQGATVKAVKLYEWEIAGGSAAADTNYIVAMQRATTKGTWSNTITPAALDGQNAMAAQATCYTVSTAAGSLVSNSILLNVGFNERAGYRWVAVPGGELVLAPTTLYNIFLSYLYAQGTDTFWASVSWDE